MEGAPCGAVLGLTRRRPRARLPRADLACVCLQLGVVLDAMRAAGLELTELRAIGGFARGPFWRQLLTDVLASGVPNDRRRGRGPARLEVRCGDDDVELGSRLERRALTGAEWMP